ncbi:hypothetical protein [uncultured Acinetobacter sp.]|uniref:hypothetical protein n=1 Tax=uncultured Acinetobacter sp. TaxID=165433 RepID=UPI00261B1780|nr:hypothetical protein [uncultured Acinetobacter sp.]
MSNKPRYASNLVWLIASVLVVITVAISTYWWLPQQPSLPLHPPQTTLDQTNSTNSNLAASEAFVPTPNKVLVDEELLKQDLPENITLIKEEIAKQDDIQQQLQQQEKMLQQQNLSADELIRLKQQQIEFLEQQLNNQSPVNPS